jgi:hypothetical protein
MMKAALESSIMNNNTKPCLVACSVFREEISQLIERGKLEAELIYVSKYFHVDYALIEKNLRSVLKRAIERYPGNVILVYGDLCLGMDDQMEKLAEEFGIVKIDALNCIDCILGRKGKSVQADPHQDLIFLTPGMTDFFKHAKEIIRREGYDEDAVKQLFKGVRGIVLLDTLGDADRLKAEVEELNTGLQILETRIVGCENVKNVINEAIERSKAQTKESPSQ